MKIKKKSKRRVKEALVHQPMEILTPEQIDKKKLLEVCFRGNIALAKDLIGRLHVLDVSNFTGLKERITF